MAILASGSGSLFASRTAMAPLALPMLERQTSATSRRWVLTHMCAMFFQTLELLMSLTARYASSMLPVVRWKLNSMSALRVSVLTMSMPTKSLISRAVMATLPSLSARHMNMLGTVMPSRPCMSSPSVNESCFSSPESVAKSVTTSARATLAPISPALSLTSISCRVSHPSSRGSVASHACDTGWCLGPKSKLIKASVSWS
mmetsp:Transcript_18176/g.45823  ORF Transcript_18176/g.45823 Transcript_18176/m.45823 type:complete len:201 (-) Transcript_18176:1968-2570(-)